MRNAKTYFEQIPVAELKKKVEEERSGEPHDEAVTRESPAEKAEPYSVPVISKVKEAR